MGKKLLVALAMEGKFASEGLETHDGDDDILTAMTRELVQNKGIGESADSGWRNLDALEPTKTGQIEGEPSLKEEDLACTHDPRPEPIGNSALVEMVTPNLHPSRRDQGSRQLSMF